MMLMLRLSILHYHAFSVVLSLHCYDIITNGTVEICMLAWPLGTALCRTMQLTGGDVSNDFLHSVIVLLLQIQNNPGHYA